MALYHLHVKNISRSDGRSAVAAAAYRAGETLENEAEERLSQFAGRRDVLGTEILLPADAPAWMGDRALLWNAAEAAERRKDARLAKEIEFSLPRELPRAAWFETARAMAGYYTAQGFVVDLAVHDDGTGHNPHVHLMLTTRMVSAAGFGAKLRAADKKTFLKDTRVQWQTIANAALAKAGISVKIDASSYAARGIDRTPGQHHAPDPEARRRRREEVAAMVRDSDIRRAVEALAIDPAAKERYPVLSQREDWPPREPPKGAVLALSPEAQEQQRYWQEVRELAASSAITDGPSREREEPTQALDEDVNGLFGKIQAATLKQGEERRQAFAEGAAEYRRLFDRVNREMVAAGVLRPENVRTWEEVSRAFRNPEFDELLAHARALEAKRNEPDRTLRATPEQIAAVARHDREMAERGSREFTPRREVWPSPPPVPSSDPEHKQEPAAFPSAERRDYIVERAQDRMLRDYEREPQPVQAQPERRQPLDPDAWRAAKLAGRDPEQGRPTERRQPLDPDAWRAQRQATARTTPSQDRERDEERERRLERDR